MTADRDTSRSSKAPEARGRVIDCRVTRITEATHDIRIVHLAREDGNPGRDTPPLDHSAGQYVRVAFAGQPERDYSLASGPAEAELELHIRDTRAGPSRFVSERLRVGDPARVRGPFGGTWLRPVHPGPILAVAGGSGLAPMKAIVEEALARGVERPIHLYFGVRDERDLYLESHFTGLARAHANLRFVPVLSEPSAPTARRTGFVTDAIAADFSDLANATAYLAGPPPMVEAARDLLPALGLDRARIHADAFIGEAERRRLHGEA